MTRTIKKLRVRSEHIARDDATVLRPAALSARDPLAYAAVLKILG